MEEFCCSGYAIDLLIELAKKEEFTYDLHLSSEKSFGSHEYVSVS